MSFSAETTPEIRTVIIEREVAHPPEKIWRALTQPHLIEEWLMRSDFKPVKGQKFTLRNEPKPDVTVVVDCEVLTVRHLWGQSTSLPSGSPELASELHVSSLLSSEIALSPFVLGTAALKPTRPALRSFCFLGSTATRLDELKMSDRF